MKPTIAYILKSFPQVSETFIVSNIVYALKKKYKVQLFVNKYTGINSTSQAEMLKQFAVEKMIEAPFSLSKNKIKRWSQLVVMALYPRVFPFVFRYYKNKSKRDTKPLLELYQYRHLKKNTVCHVHFNNALQPLLKLAKIGYIKPKVIVTFHGYDAFLETKESFQTKYADFYTKYVKAVTVNSRYLEKQLLTLGIDQKLIHLIPIGLDSANFKGVEKKLDPNQAIKLITIGRLEQLKGHTFALACIKKLEAGGYHVHYTILGAGKNRAALQKQVSELNLTATVTFKGKATQKEVKEALRDSHIFLMPSTFDEITGRREAFGLVSVEAQAMGLPVIGFNSGGFPDTLKEGITGFAVADRNASEMAEKVIHLIDHPAVYTQMSKAAIAHAKTFDHEHTTEKYIDLYKNIS